MAEIMRKAEFIDRVSITQGVSPSEIRPVLDSILSVLGQVLDQGREVHLKELGRIRPIETDEEKRRHKIIRPMSDA